MSSTQHSHRRRRQTRRRKDTQTYAPLCTPLSSARTPHTVYMISSPLPPLYASDSTQKRANSSVNGPNEPKTQPAFPQRPETRQGDGIDHRHARRPRHASPACTPVRQTTLSRAGPRKPPPRQGAMVRISRLCPPTARPRSGAASAPIPVAPNRARTRDRRPQNPRGR